MKYKNIPFYFKSILSILFGIKKIQFEKKLKLNDFNTRKVSTRILPIE